MKEKEFPISIASRGIGSCTFFQIHRFYRSGFSYEAPFPGVGSLLLSAVVAEDVTCLCLPRVSVSSYLLLADFKIAKEHGFPILDRLILGGSGEPQGFDRAYRTRALSPSCQSSLETSVVRSFVRSIDRLILRAVLLFLLLPRRSLSLANGARSLRLRRNSMSRRDRPMRRYAVRSTGLLKARSKA